MILHLIETGGPGGAEQMLLRLASEYRKRGLDQIVCLRKDGWLADNVRNLDIPLEIIPFNRLPDFEWFRKLKNLIRRNDVTAIHAHEFAMNIRAAILGKLLGLRVIATVHGKAYYGEKTKRRLAYRLVSRYAYLVAVSKDVSKHLRDTCKVNSLRVLVIPNGVDNRHFAFDKAKRDIFRKNFKVQANQLLIGTVGSYYPVKGHFFLIEAMEEIVSKGLNAKLIMAGQGPLESELNEKIKHHGLERNVELIGYIEDTPGFLSSLDIFVMPSLSEGLPLALLEAAANKRCILATRVGGIPEIIVDGESGLLVEPGDAEALAKALEKLFDPALRVKLADCARKKIEKEWSIEYTANCYLNVLLNDWK